MVHFYKKLLNEKLVPWEQGTKLSLNTPGQDFYVLGVLTPGWGEAIPLLLISCLKWEHTTVYYSTILHKTITTYGYHKDYRLIYKYIYTKYMSSTSNFSPLAPSLTFDLVSSIQSVRVKSATFKNEIVLELFELLAQCTHHPCAGFLKIRHI